MHSSSSRRSAAAQAIETTTQREIAISYLPRRCLATQIDAYTGVRVLYTNENTLQRLSMPVREKRFTLGIELVTPDDLVLLASFLQDTALSGSPWLRWTWPTHF